MVTSIEYINVKGIRLHIFHLFYSLGFLFAGTTGLVLGDVLHLKWWVIAILSVISAFTFFNLVRLVKQICGKENIVYYHHEIGILATCMLVLLAMGEPVPVYIDVTIISIGVFNILSRWGCFFVGCCHGKPCSIGVTYNHAHVKQGFPFYYENVRLFPIQLVESTGALLLVTACISSITDQHYIPGEILVMYSVIYGCGRFILEFFRGDPERWYGAGLSEAQWTTVCIVLLFTCMGYLGWIPLYTWHLEVSAAVIAIAIIRLLLCYFNPRYRYLSPHHLHELAAAVFFMKQRNINGEAAEYMGISVYTTTLGLRLSYSYDFIPGRSHYIYALSQEHGTKGIKTTTEKLASLIAIVNAHSGPYEINNNGKGTYYIIYKENEII